MNQQLTIPDFNFVAFQDGDAWVAQCLERDICAQAESLKDVLYEVQRALVGHLVISIKLGKEPFKDLPPAPKEYWDKWQGTNIKVTFPDDPFSMPVLAPRPRPEVRVAA